MPAMNPADNFSAVNVGVGRSCGETLDGEFVCWGTQGQLGPITAQDLNPDWTDEELLGLYPIGFGEQVLIVHLDDNRLYQVDIENETVSDPFMDGLEFREVDTTGGGICGITVDDEFACSFDIENWEDVEMGSESEPISFSTGVIHGCALYVDGTAECLGGEGFFDVTAALEVPDDTLFNDIMAGGLISCGLTDEDQAICWGDPQVEGMSFPSLLEPVQ